MNIIGRKKDQDVLEQCLLSSRPEFLIVYGRRRVGKTYLVRNYYGGHFSFYTTGIPDQKTHNQLKAFRESLLSYGDDIKTIPDDWFEAFRRLRRVLEGKDAVREPSSGKRIVFLDEVPWMDTARSDFKAALDFFWNSWGSSQEDLLLIVCGSATSWIVNNILNDRGGFHNRITRQLHLNPFRLSECEEFFRSNSVQLDREKIIESYMVFGGVPHYLNLYDKRLSLAQNIDSLIFDKRGELHEEYHNLFRSLFKKPENHVKIIEAMAKKRAGLQRTELAGSSGVSDGEGLTKALRELEQCGFIRRYDNLAKEKTGYFYQLKDPFVLFCLSFLREDKISSWQNYIGTPDYYAWRGNAFEMVCLNHIKEIKAALGISGVESAEYSWKSKKIKGGAQIDLLIDRRDDVINLCEMKCTDQEFVNDSAYKSELLHKLEVFREEVRLKKSLHLTMITSNGLKRNEYSEIVQSMIDSGKLFDPV